MKTVAVVPAKSLQLAKTRLAPSLSPQERAALALDMLHHVLDTLRSTPGIDSIAVISPNPAELHLPPGVAPLLQSSEGLNTLLEQGREWAISRHADTLAVAFADLPLLEVADVEAMLRLARPANTVVLAPDRHNSGTNLMLLHPPTLVPFAFGQSSFDKHRGAAHHAHARIEIYRSPGTSLDVDTPDDYALVRNSGVRAPDKLAG